MMRKHDARGFSPRFRRACAVVAFVAVAASSACGPSASPGRNASDGSGLPWPWNDGDARSRIVWIVPDPAPDAYREAYETAVDPVVRQAFADGRLTPQESKAIQARSRELQNACLARQGIIVSDDPNVSDRWDDAHQDRVGEGMDKEQQLCGESASENPAAYDYMRINKALEPYWRPYAVDGDQSKLPDPAYWEIGPEPSGESSSAAQGTESAD
ncbi:hypothetical protein G1C96_0887 [Bifidobacterium sp. DSM 109958]|uniref:Lipoprotein n=2 Tax=Bifidobacterium moraviense TaxID=2675323 RepID=A0A7Y0HZ16_9BIFI|nr:hypothetical protein [Bifidobacterium sp. DSM 109958]